MDFSFQNTEIAFRSQSNADLNRASLLFKLIARPFWVKTGKTLLNVARTLKIPVAWAIKPTLYRQFVGGETIAACASNIRRLNQYGVKSILDYSVEGSSDPATMQHTFEETLKTIENAAGNPAIPFAVFKPTAFASATLLEKLDQKTPLTEDEALAAEKFRYYVDQLCRTACERNVPVLVDAEDSWYQNFVDELLAQMMEKHNRERAIVFNTLQMYRVDRLEFLKQAISKARENTYYLGIKLVRGAYMEKERKRAADQGYPSPIQPTKEATDADFDAALNLAVENLDVLSLFCGSHNEKSNRLLMQAMARKGLPNNDARIWFSQLYGMSDHLSFNLADAGYNVSKYMPYGPVLNIVPYLIRRAEENTSIAGQTGRELSLIQTEKKRRKV